MANDVWRVRVDGRIAVGRLGCRSDADLAWETGLLRYLDQQGLTVPVPIPTRDGRLSPTVWLFFAISMVHHPQVATTGRRVAKTLRILHRLTDGWPQRPGWRSSFELLQTDRATRVDLTRMPPEAVARCRAAWARLVGRETAVVHGNPANPSNVLITPARVALIDWDEAHVDVPDLDLVLPENGGRLEGEALDIAAQASAAWEATVCWDDAYSKKRLAEVRPV